MGSQAGGEDPQQGGNCVGKAGLTDKETKTQNLKL